MLREGAKGFLGRSFGNSGAEEKACQEPVEVCRISALRQVDAELLRIKDAPFQGVPYCGAIARVLGSEALRQDGFRHTHPRHSRCVRVTSFGFARSIQPLAAYSRMSKQPDSSN